MSNDPFGRLFAAKTIESAFLTLLETWLPTYIAEVERQYEIAPESLPLPLFYGTTIEADKHPGERLPAVMVISPGTVEAPMDEGAGKIAAWYQLTVVVLVMAPNETNVRDLSGFYAAAVRGAVLQHGAIDGEAEATVWDGEEYQGEPGDQRNRTRGACLVHFRVKIANVTDRLGGPNAPAVDPYIDPADLPRVQLVEIDATNDTTSSG